MDLSMDLKTVVHCLFCLSDKIMICLFFLEGKCSLPIGEFKILNRILEPIVKQTAFKPDATRAPEMTCCVSLINH